MKNIQIKQWNFEFFTVYILNKIIEAIEQIQYSSMASKGYNLNYLGNIM